MESAQSESLWNDILAEASTSRSAPSKTLLLLGDPRSGKDSVAASFRGTQAVGSQLTGLGYQYLNVKDPQDQGASRYRLSEPASLSSTIALLCLDFSQPETFVQSLFTWLGALQSLTRDWARDQHQAHAAYDLQNAQDRLRQQWSAYQEPTMNQNGTLQQPLAGASSSHSTDDLQQGTLQDNLGLQLVVVCTKTDVLDQLEKERRYSEETFDYIQQVLRTVCLRYGAALFFTSTHRPTTLSTLKEYCLHQLFSFSDDSTSSLRTFPFLHRANVVDRDALLVPAGWDSWGKIKVLRDSFDAQATSSAWEALMSQELGQDMDEEETQVGAGLLSQWRTVVGETADKAPLVKNIKMRVTDEQDFLRTHYDLIAKDKDKQQAQSARPTTSMTRSPSEMGLAGPGVVGPMASSALHLPSVEKALGMSSPDVSTAASNGTSHARKDSARLGEATEKFARLSSRKDSHGAQNNPRSPLLSPPAAGSSSPPQSGGAPGTQNEVLANFFQSLLSARKDPNARAGSGGRGSPSLSQQQQQPQQSQQHAESQ